STSYFHSIVVLSKSHTTTKNYTPSLHDALPIYEKTKDRMRATLERSLKKTRDIKPFVKDITDKRQLTRGLTVKTLAYNDVTVEKMQALQVALPENKKMWRANSRAKAMERPHEIANDIVDDMWRY